MFGTGLKGSPALSRRVPEIVAHDGPARHHLGDQHPVQAAECIVVERLQHVGRHVEHRRPGVATEERVEPAPFESAADLEVVVHRDHRRRPERGAECQHAVVVMTQHDVVRLDVAFEQELRTAGDDRTRPGAAADEQERTAFHLRIDDGAVHLQIAGDDQAQRLPVVPVQAQVAVDRQVALDDAHRAPGIESRAGRVERDHPLAQRVARHGLDQAHPLALLRRDRQRRGHAGRVGRRCHVRARRASSGRVRCSRTAPGSCLRRSLRCPCAG